MAKEADMSNQAIGVIVDSFNSETVREGIRTANRVGATGVQLYAVGGEMHPDTLRGGARRELLSFIRDNGLEISALCGDLGGHGFTVSSANAEKIAESKKIMDLAVELETTVVTTHIGVVPEDPSDPRRAVLGEACEILGEYGDSVGARFAIETGPETAATLRNFLDSLDSNGVAVNFDPANFVMVTGDDPVAAVATLSPYIVHTHAKDGVMITRSDPEEIYGYFAEGGIGDLRLEDFFRETPLGEGDVDFQAWIGALDSIDYRGFLTIERETGDDPIGDISRAVRFLRGVLR